MLFSLAPHRRQVHVSDRSTINLLVLNEETDTSVGLPATTQLGVQLPGVTRPPLRRMHSLHTHRIAHSPQATQDQQLAAIACVDAAGAAK